MQKIMLIGSGGAGKSTLARGLGKKLSIDVYHLDVLFWKAGWVSVPKEEQEKVQNNLVQKAEWIIDGNYGETMDIRLDAADTIIFLDIHRTICTYRALKRVMQYRNKRRPDMAEGVQETFDLDFLKWIWNYPKTRRPKILKKIEQLSVDKSVIVLRLPKEVQQFLEKW